MEASDQCCATNPDFSPGQSMGICHCRIRWYLGCHEQSRYDNFCSTETPNTFASKAGVLKLIFIRNSCQRFQIHNVKRQMRVRLSSERGSHISRVCNFVILGIWDFFVCIFLMWALRWTKVFHIILKVFHQKNISNSHNLKLKVGKSRVKNFEYQTELLFLRKKYLK